MNLIKAEVTEVLTEPEEECFFKKKNLIRSIWKVYVRYQDMGGSHEKYLTFNTKEEAEGVDVGYNFLH